ncbi:MAG: hypothetical protein ACI9MC_001042 [Kiritimatiellia bacterium]|jgi:uncharacterized protein (TIGR02266 family)
MAKPQLKPDERRIADRFELEVQVTLTSDHNFYSGFTQDISEGGVFIASLDVLAIGTPVEFELQLGKGKVKCTGVVRWIREASPYLQDVSPGMGVEFRDLSPRVSAAINDFIGGRRDSIFYDDEPW